MLRSQFLCHVLKALFFIKIALKLSYFCKKMQNLRALGAPPPDPQNSPPIANFWLRACITNYLWSSGNAFVFGAAGQRFKSQASQIGHSVANGLLSQRHFFQRSGAARAQ